MRLRCANSLISVDSYKKYGVLKVSGFGCLPSLTIKIFLNFLLAFFTIRFTFKGVRKNENCLSDTHSQSFMGPLATLLTSPLPPPLPTCTGGEEERIRFYTQLLIVMIVPGVHVSELLRFDAFMNRNASLFSDRYIVTI